jgi:hypothetical protein
MYSFRSGFFLDSGGKVLGAPEPLIGHAHYGGSNVIMSFWPRPRC